MRWFAIVLVAVGLGLGGKSACADTIPYRQYTSHEGLPSRGILSLAQTSNGLLWIGTRRGLVVYDGNEFRAIALPDSADGNAVSALQPTPNGGVWAGVGSGVVKATPRGALESHPLDSHNVVEILRRDKEVVFVTHQAVWKQAERDDSLTRTPFQYETLQGVTQVWGADLGPQGRVWIVNGKRGPGKVRPGGTVDFADSPTLSSEYAEDRTFFDLRFMGNGSALVTRGSRLHRFDLETETFEKIADTGHQLGGIRRQGQTAYLTERAEVLRYDSKARRFEKSVGPFQDLPSATTTAALQGRDGGLWIGTQKEGLLHIPGPEVRHVRSVGGHSIRDGMGLKSAGNAVWGTTWGHGLFQLRPRRQQAAPGGHALWVSPRSHDGWLHGLAGTDLGGRKWYRSASSGKMPAGGASPRGWQFVAFAEGAVRGYVDSSGIGYFWHNRGLYRHVPSGDTTRRTRLRSWPVEESQHHLMGPAPNGDIILFDQGDLLRLRRPDGAVIDTVARLPAYAEAGGRRLTVDPKGRVWCPFTDLMRIDPQAGEAQTLLEGVEAENVVMSGDSLAMAKTNEGLYLLDANTGAVRRHLTTDDGLLSSDVNGALLTKDTLYVGHKSGLSLMPTESLFRRPPRPHAVLTGLEVNFNERLLAFGRNAPAEWASKSEWSPEERTVGFSYTGASLAHSDRVRYEVRLEPRDSTWKTTGRRFARYTDLAPGDYRFEVRARLKGQPPGPAAAYAFAIPPHFYETWWFRLVALIGVFGLMMGAYRWRTVRLRRRQEKLEDAVKARTRELADEKEKTERQAERLAELDEAKNRFFAHVSHEFRTPLSLILSPLRDALQRASGGAATLSENQLRRMLSNAERLQRLIDQLLDLATLEAGQMTLDLQPGDVAAVVTRVAEAFRSKAQEKGLDLCVAGPEDRIQAKFDPEKVETIVSNLVCNAVKFTPDGGRVTVSVERVSVESADATGKVELPGEAEAVAEAAEGAVRIEVTDTGPGIDPAAQEAIFERFEQVDNSATREHEGTGLGLALTGELAQLHGGTIKVDSAPGEGTAFTACLPLLPVASPEERRGDTLERAERGTDAKVGHEAQIAGDGAPIGRAATGKAAEGQEAPADAEEEPATILVVEDNAEMRAYLRETLSRQWRVLEATGGEAGWTKVQEDAPDLILSDVMMPSVGGFELCEQVKSDPDFRTVPVVLLTARTKGEDTLEGLKCGADDYVAKPFDPAELIGRIENHLAARRHVRRQHEETVRLEGLGAAVDEDAVPLLKEVVQAIEERLSDPEFSVECLAEEVALSRRQLTRRLKETVGETPAAFIRARRLERAKALLAGQAETVAEVAYAVGFRSPSHFSQAFKEEVGPTPSDYQSESAA